MTAKKKERKKNKKEKKRFVCLRCIYSKKIPECSLNEVGRGASRWGIKQVLTLLLHLVPSIWHNFSPHFQLLALVLTLLFSWSIWEESRNCSASLTCTGSFLTNIVSEHNPEVVLFVLFLPQNNSWIMEREIGQVNMLFDSAQIAMGLIFNLFPKTWLNLSDSPVI